MTLTSARSLSGDARAAAFPLGGIGTGNVSLGARGELRDWELFNSPWKGNRLPYTFFAVRAAAADGTAVTKVLESRLRPPHERPDGYPPGDVAGLPRLRDSRLRGEYPFAWIDFADDELPLAIALEAFTPLIPLDAADSGLPAAVLRYRARNAGTAPLEVTVVGSLFNAVGLQQQHISVPPFVPLIAGEPANAFRDEGALRGLHLTTSLPGDHLRHGSMALLTSAADVTVRPDWSAAWPAEAMDDLWRDLCADGRLDAPAGAGAPAATRALMAAEGLNPKLARWLEVVQTEGRKLRVGSLGIVETLAPGAEATFEFLLAWHFPNRPRAWMGSMLEDTKADQVVRNFYATRFADAWDVGTYLHAQLPRLERETRAFHASLYDSSLPAELVDAAAAGIATLRSTTAFRLEDGTFAGWEGSYEREGSCEGSCTHVWNYAQTAAFLFPELERTMRRVELAHETDADGRMRFRTNTIFDAEPWTFMPAVDGQLGTIVRLCREWRFSGDDAFLAELWPHAVRALEFALEHWDADGDLVLERSQHNTYDIEFVGPNSHANSIFYAALHAGAAMAEHLGDAARAARYRDAAARGAEAMDRMLWNGEYYVQRLPDGDETPEQYGAGCLSDQLLGQFLAHVAGLGHILPPEHVAAGLAAVHRHNFFPELRRHRNVLRTFALEDEGGLVLCTWPRGERPRRPFDYAGEVWSGVEHQVAAHLLWEGLVEQGLEIVRAVRARHDGYRRSPWNEVESGYHYARSMSSWALLLAYSGVRYDAGAQRLGFAPAAGADDFRSFFSTGTGWGRFAQRLEGAQLELCYGSLRLRRLELELPVEHAHVNDEPVRASVERNGDRTTLTFEPPLTLAAGDVLAAGGA